MLVVSSHYNAYEWNILFLTSSDLISEKFYDKCSLKDVFLSTNFFCYIGWVVVSPVHSALSFEI